jgi:hypothetical protein
LVAEEMEVEAWVAEAVGEPEEVRAEVVVAELAARSKEQVKLD